MGLKEKKSYVFIHPTYSFEYLRVPRISVVSGDKIVNKTHKQACEGMCVVVVMENTINEISMQNLVFR